MICNLYEFHNVVLPDGLKLIKIEGDCLSIKDCGISLSFDQVHLF